ncbi:hypothetical protein BDV25DRAFT_143950 [Aspergillus avenaceus]|uniref:Alpha-ketoglutarate-dependent sulfonate dioxygenase n=1 Tax=Aspergillus avenaceus TaxID=36643 RepID=A0A5N6TIL7_ASPAV|nr:hypothetical protein BDV25DRAFT_143950 [Aspergillus avenaceus]
MTYQDQEAPPAYDQIDEPQLALPQLDLSRDPGSSVLETVSQDQCIAHLKFLATLADLRDSVANVHSLFGIGDPDPAVFKGETDEACARVKEKRWAVYTARAVDRYITWWTNCICPSLQRLMLDDLESSSYNSITEDNRPHSWWQGTMPPIDVLMVWHAHMLNPRAYLEDCLRNGAMAVWSAGFPWEVINSCIDDQTMEYKAGPTAEAYFQQRTGLPWDNLQGSQTKCLDCPRCGQQVSVQWTQAWISLPLSRAFKSSYGFADKEFEKSCRNCNFRINHERLKIDKFRKDVQLLWSSTFPMPGTFCDVRGVPRAATVSDRRQRQSMFPNRLLRAMYDSIYQLTDPQTNECTTMKALRDQLQSQMKNRDVMRKANPDSFLLSLLPEEKVAFRRMMSRYWDNFSPFALDLVGAVIRQGTFVQKMDSIDWLHSPAVRATMDRLIHKYELFFHIMAANPRRMAVPTLDVDLAWHTHQLAPARYFDYSVCKTMQESKVAIFIDHDDKVEEDKLSDGFEWTSKMYKKLTNGEIYSECTCWYCEAIRAPDLRNGPFVSTATFRAREAAAELHSRPDISPHPDKNPHISAHSAVPAETSILHHRSDPRRVMYLKHRSNYEKARRRAEKRDSKKGEKKRSRSPEDRNYAYAMAWGYPIYVPYYAPYTCDPSVHSNAYVTDPNCMSLATAALAGHARVLAEVAPAAAEDLEAAEGVEAVVEGAEVAVEEEGVEGEEEGANRSMASYMSFASTSQQYD